MLTPRMKPAVTRMVMTLERAKYRSTPCLQSFVPTKVSLVMGTRVVVEFTTTGKVMKGPRFSTKITITYGVQRL